MNHNVDLEYQKMIQEKNKATLSYAARYAEEILREHSQAVEEEMKDLQMPDSLRRKMKEMALAADRAERRAKRRSALQHAAKICAAVILMVAAVNAILWVSVEAYREKVYQFFYEEERDHVDVMPKEIPYGEETGRGSGFTRQSGNEEGSSQLAGIPADWEGYWYPTWLPEGYELADTKTYGVRKIIYFMNEDRMLEFTQFPLEILGGLSIDNEGDVLEPIMVGSSEGIWYERDEYIILYWVKEEIFYELGAKQIKIDDMLKIAQSLDYIK